jgi:hypothetical protein
VGNVSCWSAVLAVSKRLFSLYMLPLDSVHAKKIRGQIDDLGTLKFKAKLSGLNP